MWLLIFFVDFRGNYLHFLIFEALIMLHFSVCRGDRYGDLPCTQLCGSNINLVGFIAFLCNPYTWRVQHCSQVDRLFSSSGGRGVSIAAVCAMWLHLRPSGCGGEGVEAGWWLAVTCRHCQNNFADSIFFLWRTTKQQILIPSYKLRLGRLKTVWQWSGWSVITSCSQLVSYRSGILSYGENEN